MILEKVNIVKIILSSSSSINQFFIQAFTYILILSTLRPCYSTPFQRLYLQLFLLTQFADYPTVLITTDMSKGYRQCRFYGLATLGVANLVEKTTRAIYLDNWVTKYWEFNF